MAAAPTNAAQTLELLRWVDARTATYDEALAVWASHCPRLTIWEDALIDGLIRVERSILVLTERGRTALAA